MSSIDTRILQMQFDNQQFESGVKTSMKTLENLNSSLQLKNATVGVKAVNSVSNSISNITTNNTLGNISQGVENITHKFSAMGIAGITAIGNITNKLVNFGISLGKSLTIDPILTGFSEYEIKMNSIKTILTNTEHAGTTIDDVKKALNDLNLYADKTIYNFAQMTDNIGKFTAAGVDLDTSVASIKGIANLAAASGVDATRASGAMYQLSQALAAGKVQLMDWKSVQNAGMGGKLFKDALIRTSEVMGTGANAAIKKYGSFNESLTRSGWLTTDVLTETLKQISGAYSEADLIAKGYSEKQAKDIVKMAKSAEEAATEVRTVTGLIGVMQESVQSGWAQTWEYIIGDNKQATKVLTSISKAFNSIIEPSAEARNEMFKFWNENGGRDDIIKGLSNVFKSLGRVLGAVGKAFRSVFPRATGQQLVEFSENFKELTEKLKVSKKTADDIQKAFKGVFTVIRAGVDIFITIAKAVGSVALKFSEFLPGIISVAGKLGDFVTRVTNSVKGLISFDKVSASLSKKLTPLADMFAKLGNEVKEAIGKFKDAGFDSLKPIFEGISKAASAVGKALGLLIDGIVKLFSSTDLNSILKNLQTFAATGVLMKLGKLIEKFGNKLDEPIGVIDKIKGVLGGLKDTLQEYQDSLKANILSKIAISIGILAAAILALSFVDPERLEGALIGISLLFGELMGSMALFFKMTKGANMKGIIKVPTAMILLSTALLILAGAMKMVSDLEWEEIAKGLVAVTGLMTILVMATKLLSGKSKVMIKSGIAMMVFAQALKMLIEPVKELGKVDHEQLTTGLLSVGAILGEIAAFMQAAKFGKIGVSQGLGILVIAEAINVLAKAVKTFGKMNVEQLSVGLTAVGVVLAELAIFTKLTGNASKVISTSIGLTILAGALTIMSKVISELAKLSWEEIGKGLTAIGGSLLAIAVAMKVMPADTIIIAAGLVILAQALKTISGILTDMGGLSWEEIGKGLTTLAGSLLILAVAMKFMSGGIVGAAAMVIMAGALAIFTPQLIALSELSLQQIGTGLLALAGVFAVIGLSALVLSPIVPVIISLAGGIALLSLACIGVGLGLSLFATGLTMLAASGAAGGLVLVNIIKELLGLLPLFGQKVGETIVSFANTVAQGAPAIAEAFIAIVDAILVTLDTCIPKIAETALKLVTTLLETLLDHLPRIIEVGTNLIIGLLKGISNSMSKIVDIGVKIVVKLINGIASNVGALVDAGINLVIDFVNALANGLNKYTPQIINAGKNLFKALINIGLEVLKAAIGPFINKGKEILAGFIRGVKSKYTGAKKAMQDIKDAIKDKLRSLPGDMLQAGKNAIRGFISGLGSYIGSVASSARQIGSNALSALKERLGINSPSREFAKLGSGVIEGFVKGMNDNIRDVKKPTANIADTALAAIKNPMNNLLKVFDSDIDMNPVITPVLDLTDVRAGAKSMNGLLSQTKALSLSTGADSISASMARIQNGNDNSDIVSAIRSLQKDVANMSNETYQINGVTYDDGSNITSAVKTLVRAAKIERRM